MADISNWIAATDRLPSIDGSYLVHCPSADPDKPLIATAWYNPNAGWSLLPDLWINAITHWMSLPAPPAEERRGLEPGLYRLYWSSGGASLAAVGIDREGRNWFAPTNWVNGCWLDWRKVKRVESIELNKPVGSW
jgi:Protein of unknown function (DUF551)